MLAILMAVQVVSAPPIIRSRPIRGSPAVGVFSPTFQNRKLQTDARTLLARAEQVQAGYAPAADQPSKTELQTQIDQLKGDLDSMAEMGEAESVRLQMAMDRMSKMMSALSNLLKKISDTQDAVVQNMK